MKKVLLSLATLLLLSSCAAINSGEFVPPEKQGRLPDLSALDQYGNTIKLRQHATSDYLLIFFYPEASTPG